MTTLITVTFFTAITVIVALFVTRTKPLRQTKPAPKLSPLARRYALKSSQMRPRFPKVEAQ